MRRRPHVKFSTGVFGSSLHASDHNGPKAPTALATTSFTVDFPYITVIAAKPDGCQACVNYKNERPFKAL
jgi:hypothetical protein